MRSAIYLQQLRPTIPPLERDEAILIGATREIEEQKKVASTSKKTPTQLQSSQSGGRSVSQNLLVQRMLQSTTGADPSPVIPRLCSLCGQPGHNSRTCPRHLQSPHLGQPSHSFASAPSQLSSHLPQRPYHCSFCGATGGIPCICTLNG